MINIAERLAENEKRAAVISKSLQQLQQDSQNLLQELLRLDGEHRLLLQLKEEIKGELP